jgi:hypothetical protein
VNNFGTVATVALLVVALGTPACDSDTSGPRDDAARISDLAVDVIDGYIRADLMPIIPPDPIACQLTLRITNTNSKHGLSGLSIPSAIVHLSKNGEDLGVIRFETVWDGSIAASEVDTVSVTKIEESQEIFVPPCREDVFLVVEIVGNALEAKHVTTPAYLFSCPVLQTGEM